MNLTKHHKNLHTLELEGSTVKIAMLSDIHWDNPKCDRKTLKRHLDYCLSERLPIFINGDLFCLMQGRGDRRSSSYRERSRLSRYYFTKVYKYLSCYTGRFKYSYDTTYEKAF